MAPLRPIRTRMAPVLSPARAALAVLSPVLAATARAATVLAALALLASAPAPAQERAALVSDRLEITAGGHLVASGHVEVFYQGYRMTAARLVYDPAARTLAIAGPIVLTDAGGGSIVLASAAELSADLRDGILTGARLLLNEQLQLAAARMRRTGGRYTALEDVVASSCRVCAAHPVPVWEIRARRVLHDAQERQIRFEDASLRVAGVPVIYLPRLRMPDPTLARATGFLAPRFRTTSDLGPSVWIPYFITLGASRDLTVTPYLTMRGSTTLGLRYREAFSRGAIEISGSITRDHLTTAGRRSYVLASGAFDLGRGYGLRFDVQTVSDRAYLLDYGISSSDMLDSRVTIERVRRDGFLTARLIGFQSLRDEDDNHTLPSLATDVTFSRRFAPGLIGGQGRLTLQTHGHMRTSHDPFDGPDPDTIADGRDVGRLSAVIDWRRSFLLGPGIEATILGEARADLVHIAEDATFAGTGQRGHAAAGIELRWPLLRQAASGATDVIEPVVQLVWARRSGDPFPNEDSTLVEFDEGNLFALDRFPGADMIETGRRVNLGLGWTHVAPGGWSIGVTLGRVFRWSDDNPFGPASGLAGKRSDWLLAATFDTPGGYAATGRLVLDDTLSLAKGELRLAVDAGRLALAGSAFYAVADASENRPLPARELRLDATWQVTPALAASARGSYDFEARRGTLAALGVEFRNECVAIDVSLSRRFTSSTSVSPTTDFGLAVDLIGFGSGKTAGPSRRCY